ncbi:MAG: hypothetical protein ABSH48_10320 [Verrucomicrobiota bacterium]|jgi:hypothetical protein
MSELRLRKQALLVESELNRIALRLQYQQLQAATAGLCGKVETVGRWWPLMPVAGFFAARLFRRPGSAFGRAVSALKWLQPLYALWRAASRKRSD